MGLFVIVLLLLVIVPTVIYLIGRGTNAIRVPSSRKTKVRSLALNRLETSLHNEVFQQKYAQQHKELQEAEGEILRLRKQLQRVEEERDILIKAAREFASDPK